MPLFSKLVQKSIHDDVVNEQFVVASYRTSLFQKDNFVLHLTKFPSTKVPIEWVVDIADESNEWHYATAYHYDCTNDHIHVMVPDATNPQFDGILELDYRVIKLVECVDKTSSVLFNKIIRDSLLPIHWNVEYLDKQNGKEIWVKSIARYLIQFSYQILIEESEKIVGKKMTKAYVLANTDHNLRLLSCNEMSPNESNELEFYRLVADNTVQFSDNVMKLNEEFQKKLSLLQSPASIKSDTSPSKINIKSLNNISSKLVECIDDLVAEHCDVTSKSIKFATLFKMFAMDGDLNSGLRLMKDSDDLLSKYVDDSNSHVIKEVQDDINREVYDLQLDGNTEALIDEVGHYSKKLDKLVSKLQKLET